jgi:hypothetical protein
MKNLMLDDALWLSTEAAQIGATARERRAGVTTVPSVNFERTMR